MKAYTLTAIKKEVPKNPKRTTDYSVFKDGKVRLLDMVIDGSQGWATELWDAIEDEVPSVIE